MTAAEGKASVYQVYPVSRTQPARGGRRFFKAWGPGAGEGGVVEGGGNSICEAAINP